MSTARTSAAILASSLLLAVAVPAFQTTAAAKPAPVAVAGQERRAQIEPRMVSMGESSALMETRLAAVTTAKSINYYPTNAGWSAMWTGFDAARVDADMARAAALGADNVRVIVFPQAFGYPRPKADYAERLRKFISIADANNLTVKLTLFDWWANYSDAAGSAAWAKSVLAPYAEDSRVLSVELKNEFVSTDQAAIDWVRQLVPAVRAAVPDMPLTLSVDGQSGAAGLGRIKAALVDAPLDYYDFHFYGNSERALAEIRRAQEAVAPDPIVIGETGMSTAAVGSEGEQGAYLARTFRAAAAAGVGSVSPWTLYDFADGAIPSNSQVSKVPAQYKFGLFRADGTPKFAASVVQAAWSGAELTNDLLDLGFEAGATASPWRPYLTDDGGTAVAARTREVARSGEFSARFSGTVREGSNLPSIRTAPVAPVLGGQKWHAEVWARGEQVTGSNEMALSWFDVNGKWLGQNSSKQVAKGDSGWTRLTVDAVAPAGATGVQLHLKSGDNKGSVWFDDVVVSPVEG
ncbi:MAG TPA: glycosyl hydrolase [Actinoplanes sp.]|nr:glycosyl hydrolase [Actinoplanes sp.]